MAAGKGKSSGGKNHRDAKTGQYVTAKYAATHKATTVSETRSK